MCMFRNEPAGEAKAEELGFKYSLDDTNNNVVLNYRVDNQTVGFSVLTPVFDSSDVGFSVGSIIFTKFQGKGYGTDKHVKTLAVAEALGLKTLLCTVNNSNTPQLKILKRFGWVKVSEWSEASLWKRDFD